jgi:hypothetical protein
MKTLQKWKRAIVIGVLMAVSQTLGAVDAASEVVLVVSPQAHISSDAASTAPRVWLTAINTPITIARFHF